MKDAIELVQGLQEAAKITTTIQESLADDAQIPVAVPNSINIADLEKYAPCRRRMTGTMTTSSIADFVRYCKKFADDGTYVFVSKGRMEAQAVLNFGTTEKAGHADNTALLKFDKTALFKRLLNEHNESRSQRSAAEFVEDIAPYVACFGESGEPIETKHAIAALRDITIAQINNRNSKVESLGSEENSLASIRAKSKHAIPTHICVNCVPYFGLAERTFEHRLSIRIDHDDDIEVVLQPINIEQHEQEIAENACDKIQGALGDDYAVLTGSYHK